MYSCVQWDQHSRGIGAPSLMSLLEIFERILEACRYLFVGTQKRCILTELIDKKANPPQRQHLMPMNRRIKDQIHAVPSAT